MTTNSTSSLELNSDPSSTDNGLEGNTLEAFQLFEDIENFDNYFRHVDFLVDFQAKNVDNTISRSLDSLTNTPFLEFLDTLSSGSDEDLDLSTKNLQKLSIALYMLCVQEKESVFKKNKLIGRLVDKEKKTLEKLKQKEWELAQFKIKHKILV